MQQRGLAPKSLNHALANAYARKQLRPSSKPRPEAGAIPWGVRAMIRKLLLPALAATMLAGCITGYTYRGGAGGGDYYHGRPSVEYRYYGGYGGGYYGGYPYYGYGGYWGSPYRYGYGYPGYVYPRYPVYRYPYRYDRHPGHYPHGPQWNGHGPRPGQSWNGPRPGQGWNGQGPRPGQSGAGPRPNPGIQPPRVDAPGPRVQTAPRPRSMNRNRVQEHER